MSARIQRVEDKNGNAVGETLPLKIERLERENAALREAVLFFPKCRWKEDAFSPSAWAAIDEKAAANVIMRRALDIARKEAQP